MPVGFQSHDAIFLVGWIICKSILLIIRTFSIDSTYFIFLFSSLFSHCWITTTQQHNNWHHKCHHRKNKQHEHNFSTLIHQILHAIRIRNSIGRYEHYYAINCIDVCVRTTIRIGESHWCVYAHTICSQNSICII